MDEKALLDILECEDISNQSISSICKDLGVNFTSSEDDKVLLFKHLEKSLVAHYRDFLEVNIGDKFYSRVEILGLLVFLKVKSKKMEVYERLEEFFDLLFFSQTEDVKALKEENERLREELSTKKDIQNEVYVDDNVDYEVLKKLEKENVTLKRIIQNENDVILTAWYNLCEEHIKNNL